MCCAYSAAALPTQPHNAGPYWGQHRAQHWLCCQVPRTAAVSTLGLSLCACVSESPQLRFGGGEDMWVLNGHCQVVFHRGGPSPLPPHSLWGLFSLPRNFGPFDSEVGPPEAGFKSFS